MNANFCPNGCDLSDQPIPQEHIDAGYYVAGLTHFSRMIGVAVIGVYDGVLFWVCPDCDVAWQRFDDDYMRELAQPYIDDWNAGEPDED